MVTVGLTGGTGYIGGALLPELHAAGFSVRAVDDRSGPVRVERPEWPVPSLDFASDTALRLLSDSDVVLHLAAVSGVMVCARDPAGTARVNISGTERLAAMCRERKIPFAFASSFAVVGSPEHLPVTESTPAQPTHEYARQKAAGEEITRRLAREGTLPTAVVRQSNVYGGYHVGGRYVAKGNVIQLFAEQAATGALSVNAPGTQRRDFVHIDDVVAHWISVARYLSAGSAPRESVTINVASGEALSVLDVAGKVARRYAEQNPAATPLRVEVVPNPRGGIELVEPEFAVSRTETERRLGIRCRWTVDSALAGIFEGVTATHGPH